MDSGVVYLVGAGPGDPRLITLRGKECIEKAQVIVYDRLVSPYLLSYASPGAEMIYVGKSPGNHALGQEKINQLLAERARENKIVVRLKGGDPFVFGRGGEEVELLAEQGIPFEIVPGITSAVAVPAYAGIPVTHRDFVSSFSVITGHEEEEKDETAIQWDKLARGKDTLIFLMGVKNLGLIVDQLVSRGKPSHTPVALIRWGTLGRQEVLQGTLQDIVDKTGERNFKPPAVIIVGEVVGLREKMIWWEKKPFWGRRVVITRPYHLQKSFQEKILELGGEAISLPTVEISPPEDFKPLDNALDRVGDFSWIVFTSINGVKFFFERMESLDKDIRELGGVKMAAIGPKTAEAVEKKGIKIAFQPEEYRAEAVAQGLLEFTSPGEEILLPRADIARPHLAQALKERGVKVQEVVTYHNRVPRGKLDMDLEEVFTGQKKPVVTFSSSSTVRNFFKVVGEEKGKELLKNSIIASIGPITSETIRSFRQEVDIEASRYTMEGLLKGIKDYLEKEDRDRGGSI
ncbi:MAG: uroporphyrinogen-III C-methyltransferase [Candidatus Syntrophonatronum acetioxidans]|uniref:uroporphyrinogen-III C-methyltransferase n=1 Tax=Candidatus Syntrophonatronum acetioxidans TaxID=1795816 RepID=A0A424Y939_9FIRM|nr:MAG: uroporphyrinogen-III C-methyltransferase [Candidatus Syntrophonatronum acetioxidans]